MSTVVKRFPLRLDTRGAQVDMTHGSGGRAMAQLIQELFLKHFDNELLKQGNDQAVFDVSEGRMVMSVDGHVISPLFFPGGDIGSLAVHGTLNDVAMSGARPRYLSAGFILEEGFPLADLDRIVSSMGKAASEAGVPVVTGDTKVVEKGKGDGVFITTTLNELAMQSTVGMRLVETQIPVKPAVASACELLGLDPLYVANEGKLICICSATDAERLLPVMQADPLGRDSRIIGEVVEDEHHFVQMETCFGGSRVVDWLFGEQLPRIC
jgi:hydrogenase maturation factor